MPTNQKKVEKFIVRQFLENGLGLQVSRLLGRHPPRPDAQAVIECNGQKRIVEIEFVEYQVDGKEGGSPGEKLQSFWRKVQESLYRRLRQNRIEVDVVVTLNEPSHVKNKDAQNFAGELVRFARNFSLSALNTVSVDSFDPEFPLLAAHAKRLILKKVRFYSFAWTCTNASAHMVGVSPKIVENLVRRKSNKTYNWSDRADKWLLVCASGRSIVAHAGPRPNPGSWDHPELRSSCKTSPFDRIFFYDLVRGWADSLK
jgi:hypothetical protein